MPLTSAGIVLAGLSLIGVPGTAGFVSKWYLILAALEQGQWWLVFLIVASSLLAVAYVWRFVEAAYFREPRKDIVPGARCRCRCWLPTGAAAGAGRVSSGSTPPSPWHPAARGRRDAAGRAALMTPEHALLAALAVPLVGRRR